MPNSLDFNRFSVNPTNIDISRSLFNMNHSVKFSCNVGEVIPFDVLEVLPGDTFTIDTSKVIRLQPLVAPIMDEVILDIYWFFVPNRLVWNHWINFMGENTESAWTPETEYNIPTITPPENGFDVGTIADYMGVPVKTFDPVEGSHWLVPPVSALPFRAYALICDQWFRSEAVMDPVHVHVDDTNRTGVNTGDQVTDIELGGKPFIACKYFDYFTGALPAPQRGEPVTFEMFDNSKAPVLSLSGVNHPYNAGNNPLTNSGVPHVTFRSGSSGPFVNVSGDHDFHVDVSSNNSSLELRGIDTTDTHSIYPFYFDNLFADLSSLSSVSVNDLRTAFAIQKYLEKSARFGGRYQEFIKGFFNVDSPDARLQRTEYLGGSRMSLNINQVEQTSATTSGSTPLGNVAGMSVTGDTNSDFTKSFTEHGFIIGCAVVRYHHTYQQGLNRMWSRKTSYDFYNPVFANLGEQAVLGREIFAYGELNDSHVFGYQERWSEYRYIPSRVCGEMRSQSSLPLDMWHLADYYIDRPTLSPEWLREDKTMLDRCLAVTSEVANQVICDFYIETEASRPMPLYSIPGLIDHH